MSVPEAKSRSKIRILGGFKYKICKVCPNCYNENFSNCSDDTFACVECGVIYDNVMQLENMDFGVEEE